MTDSRVDSNDNTKNIDSSDALHQAHVTAEEAQTEATHKEEPVAIQHSDNNIIHSNNINIEASNVVTAQETAEEPKESAVVSFLRELPGLVITAVVIAFLLKWLVIQPFYIPSQSMEPTLKPGDRVLVSKFVYRFVKPQKNDIIVFVAPNGQVDFIKRIVAVGGDTIEQRNGVVYVNGKELKGNYTLTPGDTFSFPPKKIDKGYVFVMGDNRANSSDSRVFGQVPESSIVGKAFLLYWPLDRMRLLN